MSQNASDEPPNKKCRVDSNGRNESSTDLKFDERRVVFKTSTKLPGNRGGGILYWMCRDQRVQDNWALIFAQQMALENGLPLHICFCLYEEMFLHSPHHYSVFMGEGLKAVEAECKKLNIQFHLLEDCDPAINVPIVVQHLNLDAVITDFPPYNEALACVETVKGALPEDVTFFQVDSQNIVPVVWVKTDESDVRDICRRAFSLGKRIRVSLHEFLTNFPPVTMHPHHAQIEAEVIDWQSVLNRLFKKHKKWEIPGTIAGLIKSRSIVNNRLRVFLEKKDDQHVDPLRDLNSWLQLGQISFQRLLLDVKQYESGASAGVKAGIELLVEAVIRRQLLDNFCLADDETQRAQDERLLLMAISYSGSKGLWLKDFLELNPNMTRNGSLKILKRLLRGNLIKWVIEPKMARKLYFLSTTLVPYQRSHFVAPFFSQLPPWFFNVYNETLFDEFSGSCLKFLEEAHNAATQAAGDMTQSYLSSRELLIKFRQCHGYFEFSYSDVKYLLEWLIQGKKVEKITADQHLIRYRMLVSPRV